MVGGTPRAVLDTSVLVPVWSRLLLAELAGSPAAYTPIWCEWIIAETWRVLTVQQVRRQPIFGPAEERQLSAQANTMLTALLQVMTFVSVVPPFGQAWPAARDTSDLPIRAAATRSNADFVISHNTRDFPPRDASGLCAYRGIEFITTENFVREILRLDLNAITPFSSPAPGRPHHRRRL